MMQRSSIEKATPPTSTGRVGNALGSVRTSGAQIHEAAPSIRKKRPSVTIATVSTGLPSTGRITIRSIATPPAKPQATASRNDAQYGTP